jgi:hypothetical protein
MNGHARRSHRLDNSELFTNLVRERKIQTGRELQVILFCPAGGLLT